MEWYKLPMLDSKRDIPRFARRTKMIRLQWTCLSNKFLVTGVMMRKLVDNILLKTVQK
jgi:hypothetical protein